MSKIIQRSGLTNNQLFAGQHHARYVDEDVPLHIITRVFQGRHLLRPCDDLNSIILGVVGRAQQHYNSIRLYAMAFLSNHVHLMLQGPPDQVPAFIGFIKREISRRWGRHPSVGWRGTMWHEYVSTALPSAASQVRCLKYILSQGVKEGLVASPEEWPGVHCADALMTMRPMTGKWFDATGYGRAVDAQSRTRNPKRVCRERYVTDYSVTLSPIPAWCDLSPETQACEAHRLVAEVRSEGDARRNGRPPIGRQRVKRASMQKISVLPPPPWFEVRRRMICWESPTDPDAARHLERYWSFQRAFREAARGIANVDFPEGAHTPSRCIWRRPRVRESASDDKHA